MTKSPILVKQILTCLVVSAMAVPLCQALPIESQIPFPAQPLNLGDAPFISPNVMLFMDTSASMTEEVGSPPKAKIDSAADVITYVFMNNPNIRGGLFTFDNRYGSDAPKIGPFHELTFQNAGMLMVPIADNDSAHVDDLKNKVKQMHDSVLAGNGTNTPLSEAYIEMVHYFAGQPSAYGEPIPGNASHYTSPIQYRCQKNYIIDVTDGEPYKWDRFNFTIPDSVLGTYADDPSNGENLPSMTDRAYNSDLLTSGNDLEGYPFSSMAQNIKTYTIGFSTNQQMLQDAANNGHGKYYSANNEQELEDALQKDIHEMIGVSSSSSAPGSSSSNIFSLEFKTVSWSGDLKIYNIDLKGQPVDAASNVGDRLVFTNYGIGNASRSFMPVSTSNSSMMSDTNTFGDHPESTINFLIGNEPTAKTPNPWRMRGDNLLGDFIDSNFASIDNARLVAAGANDGLLHVFAKSSSTTHPYKEVLAYAPSATLSKVRYVAQPNYGQVSDPHRYLVDGPIAVQNINMGSNNSPRTILVGALGRGGKGYYALDMSQVTSGSPASQNISKIGLWDKNVDDIGTWGKNSLGYTFGKPVIAQVNDGGTTKWVAIVSNGFNSGKKGTVYFLDLLTGNKLGEISAGSDGAKSGFGSITVVTAKNNKNIADIVYAGDMNGDVWRIDLAPNLSSSTASKIWEGSIHQPITAPIIAARLQGNEFILLFGTGSLLYADDKNSLDRQSLYGIYDDVSAPAVTRKYSVDRASNGKLLQQSIIGEAVVGSDSFRALSTNALPTNDSKTGWYLDLPVGKISAERITNKMAVLVNKLIFTTQIPSTQKGTMCTGSSGDGWVMALNISSGSGLVAPFFSGVPTSVNFTSGSATPSGIKSTNGMLSGVSFMAPVIDTQTYKSPFGEINNEVNYSRGTMSSGVYYLVNGDKLMPPHQPPPPPPPPHVLVAA